MKESRMLRRIKEEGELVRQRANILEAVDARFGAAAVAELSAAVGGLDDLERAGRVFRLALRSSALEEIRLALSAPEQPT